MTTLLFKPKQARRTRLALRRLDHTKVGHARPNVSVKERNKFLHCDPIRDACFCDDLSYIPYRFIRGTIRVRRV